MDLHVCRNWYLEWVDVLEWILHRYQRPTIFYLSYAHLKPLPDLLSNKCLYTLKSVHMVVEISTHLFW